MRELSLKDIQGYSLKILLHIHDFCLKHDIQYSLAYGTLIGAVRHKGFIPWDDDIDIVMTRENFNRFICEYRSNDEYRLVSPDDENSFIAFARVCDVKETLIDTRTPWCSYDTGVWIDVFPVDSISDNEEEHKSRWHKLHRLWTLITVARGAKASSKNYKKWNKPSYLIWLKKILFLNGAFVRWANKRLISNITSSKYEASSHCALLAFCERYGFYEKNDFLEYTTLEFEGHQLSVIKEYDKLLRLTYGDYMQLPPIEHRVPKQSGHVHFYRR